MADDPAVDTMDLSKVGVYFCATPDSVQDESRQGGGFSRLNQPVTNANNPVPVPENNPGMRGYYNDHDADDKGVNV